jgi:hypothetical protein
MLFLGRKPNCSSRCNPRLFTSRRTLVKGSSRRVAKNVKCTYGSIGRRQSGVLSRLQYGFHASVFPCWWEVRLRRAFKHLWERLSLALVDVSGPWTECRSGSEPCQSWDPSWPVGSPRSWFTCGGILICAHRLINHLSNCRVRQVVHRLKLSPYTVGQGFRFLGICDS